MPFIRGIEMSIKMMSGVDRSISSRASCPSLASPTTWTPGIVSRSARRPERTREWSSARATRSGVVIVVEQAFSNTRM
jgi:hypothetical protein